MFAVRTLSCNRKSFAQTVREIGKAEIEVVGYIPTSILACLVHFSDYDKMMMNASR